jgi:uncharacterized protein YqeY
MGILSNLTEEIKNAMRAKNALKLEALRAIKSAVILEQTASGAGATLSEEQEIKLVQKLVKQRKDSADIFRTQNREDLAEPEEAQAEIISAFLPAQLSEEELSAIIKDIISSSGAEGMKDMGKVMGLATQQVGGQADGKTISTIVKQQLMG